MTKIREFCVHIFEEGKLGVLTWHGGMVWWLSQPTSLLLKSLVHRLKSCHFHHFEMAKLEAIKRAGKCLFTTFIGLTSGVANNVRSVNIELL